MRKENSKSKKLKWIADALMSEVQKPEEEIDWEYVKLCEILLSSFLHIENFPNGELKNGSIRS